MAYVVRADVIDEGLDVVSTHEFWGATPEEAEQSFEDHLAKCSALKQAGAAGLLEVGEAEEIGDDELPEVTGEGEPDAEDAEIIEET